MTAENFRKAMEQASLSVLKQTESNLLKSDDQERLAIIREIIIRKENELVSKKEEVVVEPVEGGTNLHVKKRGK